METHEQQVERILRERASGTPHKAASDKPAAPIKAAPKAKAALKPKKHAGGRPPKYDATKHPDLVRAYACTTRTDAEIAVALKISHATLKNWKTDHPEFLAAHKDGRAELLDKGEMSLFKRMTGYDYTETSVTVEEFFSAAPGSAKWTAAMNAQRESKLGETVFQVKKTRTVKHVVPDVAAAALVLCNRRRPGYDPDDKSAGWQHVQRVEHTGANGGPIEHADSIEAQAVREAEAILKRASVT